MQYYINLYNQNLLNILQQGKFLVESTVLDTAQLRWWLLGFGGRVEVLEPEFLRDEFRKHAERMAEIYL